MSANTLSAGNLSAGTLSASAGVLAEIVRGGLVESVHLGHLVVLRPDGGVLRAVGDPDVVIYPRSSLKPVQAVAALRAGFTPADDGQLALATASHNGEEIHRDGVHDILGAVGLDATALRNTPDLPLHPPAAFAWRTAGHGPEPITQNCSGKHAAFLAACVASGWDTATYLDAEHPLQRAVAGVVAELTGDTAPPHVTVDGCGAPLFSTTLRGLARAFQRLVTADAGTDEARVARAMAARPELVAGTGRDATAAMRAVPGLIAKDGAEGVYAGALPDGTAFAFKVLDGAGRPRPAILAATLRAALTDPAALTAEGLAALADSWQVLGHGQVVGEVRVPFESTGAAPGVHA
ncbi:L-asparaginase II [Xylanimonas cellulosilytica DSM 15894]|uniref:L-asparaginase II n=1 Tax=Xylanimonas cellulosilytica (strain DSM 15894 / JCM 12276 / CECT 5975 / KCTC 9989 / LMG 20990 / NBRC 107835 / XIL07) TaxID=446471 RepID=D1BZD2_XYLCX|nr:L-asparaginase II [Xylanimonas cellulosilytica DSM 15894]